MQVTLSSPEITCDHCIATIETAVSATDGADFVAGDAATRRFTVEVNSGSVLDRLAVALAEAGYPLGPVDVPATQPHGDAPHPNLTPDWRPMAYRVERSEVGANVNYDCYCGCDAGFALDRRGVAFRDRLRFVRANWSTMAGFGSVAFVACFLPGFNLIVMPALVTAGTLLVVERHPALDDADAADLGSFSESEA